MRCQQDELYDAEETIDRGRRFGSLDEVQAWVDALRDERWWQVRYWMVARVEVGPGRRGAGSVGWFERDKNAGRMEMSPAHLSELFCLHELAHVLAAARDGSDSHDPTFARTYCELVYWVMGSLAWQRLATAFATYGIDYGQTR